ncbi:GNAT family N-acetyltransferase [Gordonia sp. DT30]|uniref:GNAT family N-acetyltransferase n=1 Tax=Gordonia sp. DT30 TaxID=3416546 RepID=UPI003CECD490
MTTGAEQAVTSGAQRAVTSGAQRAVTPDEGVLDDVVTASLLRDHRAFVRRRGRVVRYDPQVAAFIGHPPDMTDDDWHHLRELVPPDSEFTLRNLTLTGAPGAGIRVVSTHLAVQMTGEQLTTHDYPALSTLGPSDVGEMLDLVRLTRPGPFFERTIEMGTYLGIRIDGRLIAMAGERLRPPGWTEISAVCVHPEHRRRGLAATLVTAVGAHVRSQGRIPFLHAAAGNENAIRLYDHLGFRLRRNVSLTRLRTP